MTPPYTPADVELSAELVGGESRRAARATCRACGACAAVAPRGRHSPAELRALALEELARGCSEPGGPRRYFAAVFPAGVLVEIDWFGGRKACRVVGKEVYAASGKVPAGTRVFVRAETPAAAEWLDGAARLLAEWGYRTGDEAAPAEPAPPGRDAGGLFAGR